MTLGPPGSYTALLSPDLPMSPRGRHLDCGNNNINNNNNNNSCVSSGSIVSHPPPPPLTSHHDNSRLSNMVQDNLDCHRSMPPMDDRTDCGLAGGPGALPPGAPSHFRGPPPGALGPPGSRMDCDDSLSHEKLDYISHLHGPGGNIHGVHHPEHMDYGGPLMDRPHDLDRVDSVGERMDSNMNTLDKMGHGIRYMGHLLHDEDVKDYSSFHGYGVPQDRNCMDHRRPMPPLTPADNEIPGFCAGCGGRILDRYYLHAVEKQWHMHCLTCSDCNFRLDSEITCFARDGNIYCKTDYYRRFAVKNCSRCQMPISANELIMRAKDQVFHLTCFACTACNRTLKSGEQYGIRDNLVYCRMDYELMVQGEYGIVPGGGATMGPHGAGSPGGGPVPFYNGVGGVQKGRPRKRKSPMPDGDGCPPLGLGDSSDRPGDILDRDGYPHQTPRQKRVRTSFKHHQLRTMKSYFALNHNPDAKDLKQLAQKTGLSKRVLQVWFQNARAKYRRNLLKQQDSESGSGNKSGQGQGSPDGQDKDTKDTGSLPDLNPGSPALSDISSTPSLSDIQSSNLETDHNSSSNTSISDLFTSTIATIN